MSESMVWLFLVALFVGATCLVVLGVTFLVVAVVARRRLTEYVLRATLPTPARIEAAYEAVAAASPELRGRELVPAIVRGEARTAGWIGAAADFGGVFFDLVALPADAVCTLRVQARVVFTVARAHGIRMQDLTTEDRARLALVLSGADQAFAFAGKWLAKMIVTSIPMLGALVSFGVNYAMVQATGRLADKYFANELTPAGLRHSAGELVRAGREAAETARRRATAALASSRSVTTERPN